MNRPTTPLPYSGSRLDRADALRGDASALAALRRHPASRVHALWRDESLVDGAGLPLALPAEALAAELSLLGRDGEAGVFAWDLSAQEREEALRLAGAAGTASLRALFPRLDPETSARLAYARGLSHWQRQSRYCGACGAATALVHGGHRRRCAACAKLLYPRIEPAVIALVESGPRPGRCLLAKHRGSASWSTLAGFVELGESLEDAVRRELWEEAGLRVGAVHYQASQAWPFPAGLMLGFRATALDEAVRVDGAELTEARWFSRAELKALVAEAGGRQRLFNPDSIEQSLLEAWLAEA